MLLWQHTCGVASGYREASSADEFVGEARDENVCRDGERAKEKKQKNDRELHTHKDLSIACRGSDVHADDLAKPALRPCRESAGILQTRAL